jgi:hypothetical protein
MASMEQRLAELEAEVTELRKAALFTSVLGEAIHDRAYQEGRESILGLQATPQSRRLRRLQAVNGGQQ